MYRKPTAKFRAVPDKRQKRIRNGGLNLEKRDPRLEISFVRNVQTGGVASL
jgi:hypothetical protein